MSANPNMPVLVVDDYKTMVRIIRNLLKQLGFANVDEAGDGTAALNMMRNKQYGLVISDWNMESMSGLDLLKSMQADESLKHLPFVMMSSARGSESVAAARRAGAGSYLDKPFNIEALRAAICEALDLPCQPVRQQN